MLNAKKKHEYLICIDSDGTVMDTMTIKHEKCFGPAFIAIFMNEYWDDEFMINDILKHWNNTNLYRITRGINRFQGLQEILLYIEKNYDIHFEGCEEFYHWVKTTPAFSVDLLKEEIKKHPLNDVLKKAVSWSNLVNERISLLPPSNEFDNVAESLKKLSSFADLLGVSSANKDAVLEEWKRRDLIKYFTDVACQDVGSKSAIIEEGIKLGYKKENVIMLGDALGDLKAAKNNGVHFYPIIPSKEKECWKEIEKYLGSAALFEKYGAEYEQKLIKKFNDFLANGGK